MPAAQNFTITHATRDDAEHILALIHELAAYEHATSSVLATKDKLLSTLRWASSPGAPPSGDGWASTFLVRVPRSSTGEETNDQGHSYASGGDSQVVGMALYFPNYSTWNAAPGIYLEDLYVRPAFRGKGFGKALIGALAAEVKRMGGARLEWSCLKWNEPSLKFYASLGATVKEEWVVLRVDGDALEKLGHAA